MQGLDYRADSFLSKTQYSVYSCLCYFNIFSYPLRAEEVLEYCDSEMSNEDCELALTDLMSQNLVFESLGYYSLSANLSQFISKRVRAENRFLNKLSKIRRFTGLVSKFPFIEYVGVSGTCAKGLFDTEADVDYFIVTKTGRLWIGRTLLVLFKKIFLLNSRRYFCLNYFIDDTSLEISERNIFIAHELLSMAPVSNPALYQRLRKANAWANELLPNKNSINISFTGKHKQKPVITKLIERVFDNRFGDKLDSLFLKLSVFRLRKRFADFSDEEFDERLKSTKSVSKYHPRGYQKKVLKQLQKELAQVTLVH